MIRGRYRTDGRKLTFIEEGTWHQIILDLPATVNEHGRGLDAFLDTRLYAAVRAQHAKAKRDVKQAVRHEQAEQRCPKVPGDMGIRKIVGGRWVYSYEGTEVEVTPRGLRPALPEGSSNWKHKEHRETTPERALRKMCRKIKRRLNKLARGEMDRIVVRDEPAAAPPTPTDAHKPTDAESKCPAMAQLDDPVALGHLRAAYRFLGSAKLHYCRICDEEWVVFTGDWPQGGVACAGPRAGVCETISRAGYMASNTPG